MSEPRAESPTGQSGRTKRLPRYAALIVVDIKDFSGRPGVQHAGLSDAIPRVLDAAIERCQIGDLLGEPMFEHSTGDGVVRAYDPTVLPFLLAPFLLALEDELTDLSESGSYGATALRPLRMRVSLHVGPVHDPARQPEADGHGAARIVLHRLLDDTSVRATLERTDPRTTHVGAIISARVFEDAVASEYTSLRASEFREVTAAVKTYRGPAYVHVPRISGQLLTDGPGSSGSRDAPTSGTRARPRAAGGTSVSSGIGRVGRAGIAIGRDARGPITFGSGGS